MQVGRLCMFLMIRMKSTHKDWINLTRDWNEKKAAPSIPSRPFSRIDQIVRFDIHRLKKLGVNNSILFGRIDNIYPSHPDSLIP